MDVSAQLQAPAALLSRKELELSLDKAGWARDLVRTVRRRESSQYPVAMLPELSKFQHEISFTSTILYGGSYRYLYTTGTWDVARSNRPNDKAISHRMMAGGQGSSLKL